MAGMQLADTSKVTGKSQEMLSQFETGFGLVPNVVKQMANSPAALEAFLSARDSLSKGLLSPKMTAKIGITLAETYSQGYMLAARVAMAKKAGLTDEEIRFAKEQRSTDAKEDLGLSFVRNLVLRHGEMAGDDVAELRTAGYTEGEIVELIANASLNMFAYYMILVGEPAADFPPVATAFPV